MGPFGVFVEDTLRIKRYLKQHTGAIHLALAENYILKKDIKQTVWDSNNVGWDTNLKMKGHVALEVEVTRTKGVIDYEFTKGALWVD